MSTNGEKPSTSEVSTSKNFSRAHESRKDKHDRESKIHPLLLRVNDTQLRRQELDKVTDEFARQLEITNKVATGPDFAIFETADAKRLLDGRMVLFIGDSVVRAMYKDLVHLFHYQTMVYPLDLQDKGERSFEQDTMVRGGKHGKQGKEFEEVRVLLKDGGKSSKKRSFVAYAFCTRFHTDNLKRTLEEIFFDPKNTFGFPDIVLMNSGLWDLSRYPAASFEALMSKYKENIEKLLYDFFRLSEGKSHLVLMSTLPVARFCKGQFLGDTARNAVVNDSLRDYVKEGNKVLRRVVQKYLSLNQNHRISFLDLHGLATNLDMEAWMMPDGTHWHPQAHRVFSYSILSTISRVAKQNLPDSSVTKFYEACDDVRRYEIALKWLTTRHLNNLVMTMEDLSFVWQTKRGEKNMSNGVAENEVIQLPSRSGAPQRADPPRRKRSRSRSRSPRHKKSPRRRSPSGKEDKELRKSAKRSPRRTTKEPLKCRDEPQNTKMESPKSVMNSSASPKSPFLNHFFPPAREYSPGSSVPAPTNGGFPAFFSGATSGTSRSSHEMPPSPRPEFSAQFHHQNGCAYPVSPSPLIAQPQNIFANPPPQTTLVPNIQPPRPRRTLLSSPPLERLSAAHIGGSGNYGETTGHIGTNGWSEPLMKMEHNTSPFNQPNNLHLYPENGVHTPSPPAPLYPRVLPPQPPPPSLPPALFPSTAFQNQNGYPHLQIPPLNHNGNYTQDQWTNDDFASDRSRVLQNFGQRDNGDMNWQR